MIRSELKKAILNKKFFIIVFIGILIHILSAYNEIYKYLFFNFHAPDIQTPQLQTQARALVNKGLNIYSVWFDSLMLYTPLMPIIAGIPFSTSYLEDIKNNMIKYIDIRINHNKYLAIKIFVNGLIGGIAVALPTIIITIIISIFFKGTINDFYGKQLYGGVFNTLLKNNFYLYIIVHVFIEFIFGFAYSSIALATSSFINNTIVVLISPFLFWIGGDLILQFLNIQSYLPTGINQFYLTTQVTFKEIILELLFITLISSIIFILKARKRNVYEKLF